MQNIRVSLTESELSVGDKTQTKLCVGDVRFACDVVDLTYQPVANDILCSIATNGGFGS